MRIVAKDDCFIAFTMAELMKRSVPVALLAREEKVHSQVLVDALDSLVPDPYVVGPLVPNPYAMPFQIHRTSLGVSGADLIVIGSFSDVTIRLYKHKVGGWRFFELHDRLPYKDAMAQLFDREPLIAPEKSMENTVRLFEYYQQKSPGAKKLWINYPYVSGDMLAWDSPYAAMQGEPMRLRFERFTSLSHSILAPLGVAILDIPPGIVQSRNAVEPWHYTDPTYTYAATMVANLMGVSP